MQMHKNQRETLGGCTVEKLAWKQTGGQITELITFLANAVGEYYDEP